MLGYVLIASIRVDLLFFKFIFYIDYYFDMKLIIQGKSYIECLMNIDCYKKCKEKYNDQ